MKKIKSMFKDVMTGSVLMTPTGMIPLYMKK
jgi:hypothetical protein